MSEELKPEKPFGYDIEVEFACNSGKPVQAYHFVGSESQVRRKGMMKKHAVRILSVKPLTRSQYVNTYGLGRM